MYIYLNRSDDVICVNSKDIICMRKTEFAECHHSLKSKIDFIGNSSLFVKETVAEIEQKIDAEERRLKFEELCKIVDECRDIINKVKATV